MSEKDAKFLRLTFDLVEESLKANDGPFGALLERDGKVFLSSINFAHVLNDPTRHAETVLVLKAMELIPGEERKFYTLYSSTEPCWTCSSVAIEQGFRRIVYGCSASRLSRIYFENTEPAPWGAGQEEMPALHALVSTFRLKVEVIGPLLEDEAAAQHQRYWPSVLKRVNES